MLKVVYYTTLELPIYPYSWFGCHTGASYLKEFTKCSMYFQTQLCSELRYVCMC